ncbi:MAG: DUF2752 domain-containing protein [Jatrophihabitantaceae bacterium]
MTRPVVRSGSDVRTAPVRVLALLLAGTVADVGFDPEHRHIPLCPFHALTGWQCPLCGGLRCVDALAHARVSAAVHDNVLVVTAIPVVAVLWMIGLMAARAGRERPAWPRAATAALIALAVGFTVVRNLPFASALRP